MRSRTYGKVVQLRGVAAAVVASDVEMGEAHLSSWKCGGVPTRIQKESLKGVVDCLMGTDRKIYVGGYCLKMEYWRLEGECSSGRNPNSLWAVSGAVKEGEAVETEKDDAALMMVAGNVQRTQTRPFAELYKRRKGKEKNREI